MELCIYPDPVLRQVAGVFDESEMDEAIRIAEAMVELMYEKRGVGLAGPQAGEARRIYVIDVSEERNRPLVLINPEVEVSEGKQLGEEGCLSFPGIYGQVSRPEAARVSFIDTEGEPRVIEGEGLLARALLHELDHLNGVLFVDRLGAAGRLKLRKDLRELERRVNGG